jgi:ATP-dependent Clp protease ATP-binding subunit ClpX
MNTVLDELNNIVYKHEKAKKALITLVRRAEKRAHYFDVLGRDSKIQPMKLLLVGPSGTGKTHLLYSLKNLIDFPLVTIDATQLTPSGNSDGINLKGLKNLIRQEISKYEDHQFALNRLVIFVDEIDKLGISFDSSGQWNKHVQANFLTMIDNKEDYRGVSWVFAGAFSNLYEKQNNTIGFSNKAKLSEKGIQITDEDIIRSGLITELVGRITYIVELDRFNKDDYLYILENILLPNRAQSLYLSEDVKSAIVEKATKSRQGVRFLARELDHYMLDAEYDQLSDRDK